MSDTPAQSRVLDYGPPEPLLAKLRRRIHRPSKRTAILLLAACIAQTWFWMDHEPWVVQHTFPIAGSSLAGRVSLDGTRLVVGANSSTHGDSPSMEIYDVQTGKRVCGFSPTSGLISDVQLSPDGTRLITTSGAVTEFPDETDPHGVTMRRTYGEMRRPVLLWDATNGKLIAELDAIGDVNSRFPSVAQAVFSPDGGRIVVFDNKHAALFHGRTGAPRGTLERRDSTGGLAFIGDSVFFSPTGDKVVLKMHQSLPIRICSTLDGRQIGTSYPPEHGTPNGIHAAFSPDGSIFAAADFGWLYLLDASTGRPSVPPIGLAGNTYGLWFSPDGGRVFVLDSAQLSAVDVRSGQSLSTTRAATTGVGAELYWSPNQQEFVLVDWDGKPQAFDGATLKPKRQLPILRPSATGSFFSKDGTRASVLTTSSKLRVEFLATDSWRTTSSIEDRWHGMAGQFTDVLFVGGAKHVLTATDIGIVRLWKLRRPEGVLGVAALMQLWFALLLLAGFVWSARRDIRGSTPINDIGSA